MLREAPLVIIRVGWVRDGRKREVPFADDKCYGHAPSPGMSTA